MSPWIRSRSWKGGSGNPTPLSPVGPSSRPGRAPQATTCLLPTDPGPLTQHDGAEPPGQALGQVVHVELHRIEIRRLHQDPWRRPRWPSGTGSGLDLPVPDRGGERRERGTEPGPGLRAGERPPCATRAPTPATSNDYCEVTERSQRLPTEPGAGAGTHFRACAFGADELRGRGFKGGAGLSLPACDPV